MNDQAVVGRLAPSPTGALHLGNARSFLLAWLSARSQSGRVILRIEDIDSPRVKPWAVQSTIEDLAWLGLDWDDGPDSTDLQCRETTQYVQSNRMDRYRSIVEKLIEDDRCFPCTCSRNDIANAQSAPHESSEATAPTKQIDGQVYPGTCRKKQLAREQLPEKHAWRWKFEPGSISWTDALSGRQELEPSVMLGDFVIAKSNLAPSYQLAVVIDDHDMGVTEIIRGDDLIYSTFRQLSIQRHLSWQPPRYCHVPLIVGEDGRRLAKRHGDTRLSYFRDSGIRSQAIVGYLAWTLGMLDQLEPCSPSDLIPLLNWQQIPRKPTVFSLQRDRAFLQAIS